MESNEHTEICKKTCGNNCLWIISIVIGIIILLLNFIFIFSDITPDQINSFNSSEEATSIPVDGLITLDTNRIVEGTAISHTAGSSEFIINEAGNYYVSFNVSAFEPPEPGIAAILSVTLQQNSTDVLGTLAGETVSASFQLVNLNFSVIIEADAGDVLTVMNTSVVPIEILQPNINIIKIN